MQLTGGVQINGGYISGYVAEPLAYTTSPALTDPGPINSYYWRQLYKVIYTAAELNAAGLSGSTQLTGLMLYVISVPSPLPPTVIIGLTNTVSAVGSDITSGWTTVFNGAYPQTPTLNSATNPVYSLRFEFSSTFTWDGTSNLGIGFADASRGAFTTGGTVATNSDGSARFTRADLAGAYALTDSASSTQSGRAICYLVKK